MHHPRGQSLQHVDLEDAVIQKAREHWVREFGRARYCTADRVHKGLSQPRTNLKNTEVSMLRARAKSIREIVDGYDDEMDEAKVDELQAWGPTHAAELAFQIQKGRKRKAETLRENLLLDEECDDGVKADAKLAAENDEKSRKIRVAAAKKVEEIVTTHTPNASIVSKSR